MKAISIQSVTRVSTQQILVASMIGSTIELFDFYFCATAAALATFGIAFFARPF